MQELAHRVTPSFDFYLFTVMAGLALAIAILIDSPAFYVLAALLSPFMAPVVGMAFSTILGSGRFMLRMLGGLLLGSIIMFAWGALAGWAARLWPGLAFHQVSAHAHFSWPDLFLLVLGAGLTALTLVRSPNQRPLVTSVAIAYELYLPAGVAGFGLTSGLLDVFSQGLLVFVLQLTLAVLAGAVVLALVGLHPLKASGYGLGAVLGVVCLGALFATNQFGMVVPPLLHIPGTPTSPAAAVLTRVVETPTLPLAAAVEATSTLTATVPATPSLTASPSPSFTPTNTLVPSRTPTETITPAPTPVWAYIHSAEGGGAVIRETPSFKSKWVKSILNGTLVEVISDGVDAEGVQWVQIHTSTGDQGWIVRALLTTATPAPAW